MMLGHCGSDRLQKTAKIHGFKLIGELHTCENCVIAKVRWKNVNKECKVWCHIPGEQFYLYISSIKGLSYGGSKLWALIVNDYSDYCWNIFLINKSELMLKSSVVTILVRANRFMMNADWKVMRLSLNFIA